MGLPEYSNYDGLGLAELVRKKKVKPIELVEAAIERIERHNQKLNAVVFKAYDDARARAQTKLSGAFAGVPMLLKDILGFKKGWPNRDGSRFVAATPNPYDSTLVTRFEAAGLIPLGKTNVPEFGIVPLTESKLYGPARNPWNLSRSTGGSSGGSAAAVAAGIVPIAHANDGGGSIRIPASCCGLVGLKPTRGRNPLGPDDRRHHGRPPRRARGEPQRARHGGGARRDRRTRHRRSLCRSAAARLLSRRHQKEAEEAPHRVCDDAPRRRRARSGMQGGGGSRGEALRQARPPCRGRRAGNIAGQTGSQLVPADLGLGAHHVDRLRRQGSRKEPAREEFEGLTWGLYQYGKTVTAAQYQLCWATLQGVTARQVAAWQARYDAWITPVLAQPPLKIGTVNLEETNLMKGFAPIIDYVPFTAMQNVTGQPAISLPLSWSKSGLPIGVQFVGRFGEEHVLLSLAAQIEKAAPWSKKKPPVYG